MIRSLLALKAMAYEPTGGIVAAPTTSLPEEMGGIKNWDYRFTWIRDASLTLYALLSTGFEAEADAWRRWILRAAAGRPEEVQILYGIRGERQLPDFKADWLAGYGGSKPVHVGNAASSQFQLGIYGELMSAMHLARVHTGQSDDGDAWRLQREIMDYVEQNWHRPRQEPLGGPRAGPPLHPEQGDGLGGRRPVHPGRRAVRVGRAVRPLADAAGTRSVIRSTPTGSTSG